MPRRLLWRHWEANPSVILPHDRQRICSWAPPAVDSCRHSTLFLAKGQLEAVSAFL